MSDPTQIQIENTFYAELSVFASVTFIFETETNDLPEVSDAEEPGIITTSADLAEKTEEIIQTIVTESQKAPRTTGSLDTTADIIFTGIVVVAEVTEEIIGTTKIANKGDISAIGSWGKSFNLDLIGAINDKFYMGVPVSGVLSSTLNIPDLKFYIGNLLFIINYLCSLRHLQILLRGQRRSQSYRRKLLLISFGS